MGEGLISDSVHFSVRGAIECTAVDYLDAAIKALEKAAGDTPESLAREWRERVAERERLACQVTARRPVTPPAAQFKPERIE